MFARAAARVSVCMCMNVCGITYRNITGDSFIKRPFWALVVPASLNPPSLLLFCLFYSSSYRRDPRCTRRPRARGMPFTQQRPVNMIYNVERSAARGMTSETCPFSRATKETCPGRSEQLALHTTTLDNGSHIRRFGAVGMKDRQSHKFGTVGMKDRQSRKSGTVGKKDRQSRKSGTVGKKERQSHKFGAVGMKDIQSRKFGTVGKKDSLGNLGLWETRIDGLGNLGLWE